MSDDRLEALLQLMNRGDLEAAAVVFQEYEPYLRMVVRRKLSPPLRAKFDSMDIVQSVWADLLQGFHEAGWQFPDVAHLRSFLTTATRNRFIDRFRQHRAALERNEAIRDHDLGTLPETRRSTPSDNLEADDLWNQILSACPPVHHRLVLLKRQGLSLAEIAARTGLHKGSVRRILYNLAQRLGVKPEVELALAFESDTHPTPVN